MLRGFENLKFIKGNKNGFEIQMRSQGEMIEMSLDFETLELESGIQHCKGMINLSCDYSRRRFPKDCILLE